MVTARFDNVLVRNGAVFHLGANFDREANGDVEPIRVLGGPDSQIGTNPPVRVDPVNNLLLISGRSCANGVPVPTTDPAWVMFVQEVRDVSMKSYKAAQAKDQEKMIDLSEALSRSCAGCHRKWRDRRTPDNRCK